MGKKSKPQVVAAQKEPSKWIPIGISLLALVVSGASAWQSSEARRFTYRMSLPAITAKIELTEPITAGKKVILRIRLENKGQTAARGIQPEVGYGIVRSGGVFTPVYPNKRGLAGSRSDLPAGAETTLTTVQSFSLEHDHDVELLKTGGATLHIYGRSRYRDIEDVEHEVHFCGQYQEIEGLKDPLALVLCPTYNETIDVE